MAVLAWAPTARSTTRRPAAVYTTEGPVMVMLGRAPEAMVTVTDTLLLAPRKDTADRVTLYLVTPKASTAPKQQ